jgi:hypothetical protein
MITLQEMTRCTEVGGVKRDRTRRRLEDNIKNLSFRERLWRCDQAKLEGSSCTSIMTYTRGCGYSF